MTLEIEVKDRAGRTVCRRHIANDLALRNFLCLVKLWPFATGLAAADGMTDVTNVVRTSATSYVPRQMLGSGTTPPTSSDYRIQTPLYTAPDASAIGTVLPGAGNQVVCAVISSHTFAAQTVVTEAGILNTTGSSTTYLNINNFQLSRDVFTGVTVPAGGTFTGTYTWTVN